MARRALPLLFLVLAAAAVAAAPVVRASAEDGELGAMRRRLLQDVANATDVNGTDVNGTAAALGYISYAALVANSVPCPLPGTSYYNCHPGGEANPYERGCSQITRCRD